MISNAVSVESELPDDLVRKITNLCRDLDTAIRGISLSAGLSPALVPALLPCKMLFVLDRSTLHIVYSHKDVGGIPLHRFLDRQQEGPFNPQEILQAAIIELGFTTAGAFYMEKSMIDQPSPERSGELERIAREHVERQKQLAARPRAVPGFEGLQPYLDAFYQDHPEFEKNVFIAMRFRTEEQYLEIHAAIKSGLAKYGLNGVRVDEKTYPPDGDLWTNICVYMMGCKLGVCVFEEVDEKEFNPNVPLEYGFMRAMNRRVLLLKDKRMKNLPSDMTGKLYKSFDTYKITETIHEQIKHWAERDLGLSPIVPPKT